MRSAALAVVLVVSSAFAGSTGLKPDAPRKGVKGGELLAPLEKKVTSLLGDRLRVVLPEGARLEARGHSIMAAGESSEAETRAMMDLKGARWVLFAQELYLLSSAAPLDDAKQLLSKWDNAAEFSLVPLSAGPGVKGALLSAKAPKFDQGANLLRGAWVALGDGTLQFVGCYVNPGGKSDGARWAEQCETVLATLSAGDGKLKMQAGDRTLGRDGLVLSAPEGTVMRTQEGPDFAVYRFELMSKVGATSSGCGVYIGGHASWQWSQQDVGVEKVKKSDDAFLGKKTEWHSWSKNSRTTLEVQGRHGGRYVVHGFCSTSDEAELGKLRAMLMSLRAAK